MKRKLYFLIILSFFEGAFLAQAQQIAIVDIKRLRQASSLSPDSVFKEYTVEGYFFKDPLPILVTNTRWSKINARMPDSVFITLDNKSPFDYDRLSQGSFLRITGVINPPSDTLAGTELIGNRIVSYDVDFKLAREPEVLEKNLRDRINPYIVNTCVTSPALCKTESDTSGNIALLYSGGANLPNAHIRYWNDLKFMYQTLRSQYGYKEENIIVVYKDGLGEDDDMVVDYAANRIGLDSAFEDLSKKLNTQTDLFILMTNHGGGYHIKEKKNIGGSLDARPSDEVDKYKYDEVSFYYDDDTDLLDDTFCQKVNNLEFGKLIAVFEQCFSGGFLYDLRGQNRVIISAATEFEYSWSNEEGTYDIFSYHFTAALNKSTHDNIPVDADANKDSRISMLEAFNHAKRMDDAKETPLLEDTGDGIGTKKPKAKPGLDGWFANSSFLGR